MGFAAPVLAAVSAGTQVLGAVAGMRQQMRQESYNQMVAQRNAQIQQMNAERAAENARQESVASQAEGADWGEQARLEIGALRARAAAGNLVQIGSIARQVAAKRQLSARDQLRIRMEGSGRVRARQQEAHDFGIEAENNRISASMAASRRRQGFFSGLLNIGSTIIGGAQAVQQARA